MEKTPLLNKLDEITVEAERINFLIDESESLKKMNKNSADGIIKNILFLITKTFSLSTEIDRDAASKMKSTIWRDYKYLSAEEIYLAFELWSTGSIQAPFQTTKKITLRLLCHILNEYQVKRLRQLKRREVKKKKVDTFKEKMFWINQMHSDILSLFDDFLAKEKIERYELKWPNLARHMINANLGILTDDDLNDLKEKSVSDFEQIKSKGRNNRETEQLEKANTNKWRLFYSKRVLEGFFRKAQEEKTNLDEKLKAIIHAETH